jgi:hypothetical protein
MGRKQFLQSRAGNRSKVAIRTPIVLDKRFFVAPNSARSSGLTPHKRPLGQHSKFCVRLFESITPLCALNGQSCSFWRRVGWPTSTFESIARVRLSTLSVSDRESFGLRRYPTVRWAREEWTRSPSYRSTYMRPLFTLLLCALCLSRSSTAQLEAVTVPMIDKTGAASPFQVSGRLLLQEAVHGNQLELSWGQKVAGCPTHRALCDEWALRLTPIIQPQGRSAPFTGVWERIIQARA